MGFWILVIVLGYFLFYTKVGSFTAILLLSIIHTVMLFIVWNFGIDHGDGNYNSFLSIYAWLALILGIGGTMVGLKIGKMFQTV